MGRNNRSTAAPTAPKPANGRNITPATKKADKPVKLAEVVQPEVPEELVVMRAPDTEDTPVTTPPETPEDTETFDEEFDGEDNQSPDVEAPKESLVSSMLATMVNTAAKAPAPELAPRVQSGVVNKSTEVANKAVKLVKIKPRQTWNASIGGTKYEFKKGVVMSVPENVKKILEKQDLLMPL